MGALQGQRVDHGNRRLYLRREHAGPGHRADLEPGAAAARPDGGDRAGRSGRPGGVRHRRASPAGFPGVGAADAAGGRGRAHQDHPAVERGDGAVAPTIRCGSISNSPRSICCPAAAPRSWPGAARSSNSFPLFGYDLNDYDELFAEKLELLVTIRDSERVTWQGEHRAPLHDQAVYPRTPNRIPIWVAVGGNPPSAIRAGTLGLPMALAIIGGMPERFRAVRRSVPRGRAEGRPRRRQTAGRPQHPRLRRRHLASGRRRVLPELRRADDPHRPRARLAADHARAVRRRAASARALAVGSPEQVIEKILYQHEALGHQRYLMQMSVGTMPHAQTMRSIELFGTKVAPAVRKALKTT